MTKAAHFVQGDRTGTSAFVIVPQKNTTALAIASDLKKYFAWISASTQG